MVCDLTGAGGVERVALRRGHRAGRGRAHGPAPPRGAVAGAACPRRSIRGTGRRSRRYGRGAGYQPETSRRRDGLTSVPDRGRRRRRRGRRPAPERVREPRAGARAVRRRDAAGARSIQVFDPLSLGVLAPPGELGADIAVAEGQGLGNHLGYGGPYLGIVAARHDRTSVACPGASSGETIDVDGPARLRADAAGARTAHPAREGDVEHLHEPDADGGGGHGLPRVARAPRGSAELGRQCAAKARYAANRLEAPRRACGWRMPDAAFFKEFAAADRSADPRDVQRDVLSTRIPGRADHPRRRGRRPAGRGDGAPHPRGDRRLAKAFEEVASGEGPRRDAREPRW